MHTLKEFLFLEKTTLLVSLQYESDWDGAGNYNFHTFLSLELLQHVTWENISSGF